MQVSQRMWSLWPRIYAVFKECALEYFENILIPLDSYITKDPTTFLSNPAYLQQVCACLL